MKYFAPLFFIIAVSTIVVRADFDVNVDDAKGEYLVSENGTPVFQYNYKTVPLPEGFLDELKKHNKHVVRYAVPRSNYIQPFFDIDGNPITKDWSVDEPHHRGIYWAFPEVGYKGELADLHALQNVFARPTGKISAGKTDKMQFKLVAENVWKWKDEEPIVNELVTFTVFPRDANGRKINIDIRLESLVDEVTIARRETKAYGGLNIRMQPLADWNASALYEKENAAQNPAWVCASWKNPKSEGRTELTVFEKATNPDYPGELIQYPNLNWFQPTFPKSGTRYTLKKSEPLTLHYQLWLHDASFNDDAKKKAWADYQE
ncbi:hypothetical protein FACS1894170_00010 [Planctomycetales bacterium]|nr:hypothetical protein FACS1894170_00010 [Planctomycetales bacterium]